MTAGDRRHAGGLEPPPPARRRGLERVWAALQGSRRIVLTTHVNADGDGAGSQAAVAHSLARLGTRTWVVNPTPFPELYRFLLGDVGAWTPADPEGRAALQEAELVLVLDTSEPSRVGAVGSFLEGRQVAVLDHHPPEGPPLGEPAVRDPTACATGELVHDLLEVGGVELGLPEARGIYVAITTDTGSFRYGNTTDRAHAIAGRCLRRGVDPAAMYRHLYARYTAQGLDLLRRALATLGRDEEARVTWITLTRADLDATGAAPDDSDDVVEYARRLRGTEVAVLFRELADGRTKASLRSNGATDVSGVAMDLGGGGHPKAAGAVLNAPLEEARREVLGRLREAVRAAGAGEPGAG